jgi:predicted Holliday junction resolvase-like endonuclease
LADTLIGLALGLGAGLLLATVYILVWKARYVAHIRRDAVQRSLAVTVGKVQEQLIPYLPDFPFNPKDARFIGSPVDFVVFDGLDGGALERVVFVEVKTGAAGLSSRERQVRNAVESRRVEWVHLRTAPPAA